ncbi:phosphoadenylyl-sulfate reductase [Botrimarina mediterranea]|uniref:Adenosine 5'-phosphosulfate reductase n=1 Tax=Botrimarina mediterranea TaxID=2528022 RepID=A0A518K3I4_9BACT|nr:phosphoadenylyl-sulfate reductase [Botrimarina mediterranea]QDV72366.1 Phosphoadenosine phosphosulfate reductase [Botrimarina mediterranea]QDV76912.1 Phosphoadenosine phosphosulfate reductase [Planctomycetes bacterium K2D]CAE7250950.1 cysH [Symbiodinium sp. CCMP2456]
MSAALHLYESPLPAPPAPGEKPSDAFLADLAAESQRLESATPDEILAWAHERYAPGLAMGTAFGPEGCLLLSLLPKHAPTTYVFNLDTGYQFQQTLDLRDRIVEKYGLEIDMLQPELAVPEYEALHGGPLYKTDPDRCCHDRKIKVLERAAVGRTAWMSGIRRDQSAVRAKQPIVAWDRKFHLVKISPLANATKQGVWTRLLKEGVPYNPLHDEGYPSIGCWPCTQAVTPGANGADDGDERAGRWAGKAKTECGLHTDGSGI